MAKRKSTVADLREIMDYVRGKGYSVKDIDSLVKHYSEQLEFSRFHKKELPLMLKEVIEGKEEKRRHDPVVRRSVAAKKKLGQKREIKINPEAARKLSQRLGAERDRVPKIGGQYVQTPSHFLRAVSRSAHPGGKHPTWATGDAP